MSRQGQVCDRCRQKKIKCNGVLPVCSNCTAAAVPCQISAKLKRKTTIRGFASNDAACTTMESLQQQIEDLGTQLQIESQAAQNLRNELKHKSAQSPISGRPRKLPRPTELSSIREPHSSTMSVSEGSVRSNLDQSASIIRHMGRLVNDESNIGRFAGSTTGVHFVSSVEELCHRTYPSIGPFEQNCFRMHLLQPSVNSQLDELSYINIDMSNALDNATMLELSGTLQYPDEYYLREIDIFMDSWQAFCPVIPRDYFTRSIITALSTLRSQMPVVFSNASTLQTLLLVLAINQLPNQNSSNEVADEVANDLPSSQRYVKLALKLYIKVVAFGDLWSLHALIVFSLYLQISRQTSWLVQITGTMVRLGQSLGLHRHARRFRFSENEIELRKRMWWWVYGFDKITSIMFGLPKLIQDSDVDTDMPIDCDLRDINDRPLAHPLPGESTPVALYIHYIQLLKLVSKVLSQLYTTSSRRDGADKIGRLDRDLRVWHHGFTSSIKLSPFEIGDISKSVHESQASGYSVSESRMAIWLELMANFAMILIHRPALTFDSGTQQFRDSLKSCLRSSTAVLHLIDATSKSAWEFSIFPVSPSLIFQCALVYVLYRSHADIASETECIAGDENNNLIGRAIMILRHMEPQFPPGTTSAASCGLLQGPIRLLQNLDRCISSSEEGLRRARVSLTSSDKALLGSSPTIQPLAEPDFWSTSPLSLLNTFDAFDWDFGAT